ncbi:MAG: GHKL domain-containing protein [Candidatus Cloacimonetes bacterium]|nr:GHKL domain-containing protein [Candidatus Cloacimonadota bacterium]MCF7869365.1 GHKL domain-containing protein [Candidatus Cloacimonadota bacterium]
MNRLLGKQSQDLEKRIIISYFFFTFLLIIILLIFEWQLAQFGISQYEEININNYITEFNIGMTAEKLTLEDAVTTFSKDDNIIKAVHDQDVEKINQSLIENLDNLVISNRDRNIWYGTQWDLIDIYLPQIFRKASQNVSGSFVAALDRKLYIIAFSPCLTEDLSEMVGICITSKRLNKDQFSFRNTQRTELLTFEKKLNLNLLPELENMTENIKTITNDLLETNKSSGIFRLNRDYAIGILLFEDMEDNLTGLFIVSYQRFVNSFVQQSVLLFILILIAISLIMLSLLGNWFSRAILLPVKNLNKKMKEIASNPSDLGEFEKKYTGILGEMVNSFNIMNIAISNHSKTLNEYKMIIDNIETGIFWLDAEFNIILCNPSFLKIVERNKINNVIGMGLSKLLGLKEKLKFKVLAGNNIFHTLKVQPIKDQNKYVILHIRAEKNDNPLRFFGSITDITSETKAIQAKEALEIELIKSNKLAEIGRNVEGIVHNLNSPLNSIVGYSQLVSKKNPELKDIDKILNAGKSAARIVKGLLDRVKKSNASMVHPIDINEVILQELELCNHNLFYKHFVILEKDLEEDLPKITANFGDLSLCLANIFNNAFDAMKDSNDKRLFLRTRKILDDIIIEVEDTGEGIPKQNLEKIFEAYFTTKHDHERAGFGLGLAITKQVIEKQGGSIKVESELGKGTKFIIKLPIFDEMEN